MNELAKLIKLLQEVLAVAEKSALLAPVRHTQIREIKEILERRLKKLTEQN